MYLIDMHKIIKNCFKILCYSTIIMLQKHYTKQNSTTLNSIELNSVHSGIQRKWPVQDNSQTEE